MPDPALLPPPSDATYEYEPSAADPLEFGAHTRLAETAGMDGLDIGAERASSTSDSPLSSSSYPASARVNAGTGAVSSGSTNAIAGAEAEVMPPTGPMPEYGPGAFGGRESVVSESNRAGRRRLGCDVVRAAGGQGTIDEEPSIGKAGWLRAALTTTVPLLCVLSLALAAGAVVFVGWRRMERRRRARQLQPAPDGSFDARRALRKSTLMLGPV